MCEQVDVVALAAGWRKDGVPSLAVETDVHEKITDVWHVLRGQSERFDGLGQVVEAVAVDRPTILVLRKIVLVGLSE